VCVRARAYTACLSIIDFVARAFHACACVNARVHVPPLLSIFDIMSHVRFTCVYACARVYRLSIDNRCATACMHAHARAPYSLFILSCAFRTCTHHTLHTHTHTHTQTHTHTHTPVQVLCDEFCFRVNAKISKITEGTTATQVARRRDAFTLVCTAVGEFERSRYSARLQVCVCVWQ
jgi:hypothetical protein